MLTWRQPHSARILTSHLTISNSEQRERSTTYFKPKRSHGGREMKWPCYAQCLLLVRNLTLFLRLRTPCDLL